MWGCEDLDDFIAVADGVKLDGVVESITVPFLICHGENDRQIPGRICPPVLRASGEQPEARAAIFTPEEGATEHIGLDHLSHVSTFVANWAADTFAEVGA